MRDFIYIRNEGNENEGIATMLLYDQIGQSFDKAGNILNKGINGSRFAAEMQWLQNNSNVKAINIHINSFGGSVSDGFSIISSILHSNKPVNTIVDGMAYSISALIALVATGKRSMMDFATLLIHNPSNGSKKFLDAIKENLITILSNNSKITPDKLSELMNDETVFNAEQALALGLVDEIITSNTKIEFVNDHLEMFNVYNSVLSAENKIQNTPQMTEEKNSDLQNQINELTASLEAANKANQELNDKVAEMEKAETEKREAQILEMVNSFEIENEDEKASAIKFARIDFEGAKNMLNKMSSANPVSLIAEAGIKNTSTAEQDPRSKWTIRDYEIKDPKELKRILRETPERYTEMFNAFYNK